MAKEEQNLYYLYTGDPISVKDFLKVKNTLFFNEKEPISIIEFLQFKSHWKVTNEESIRGTYVTNEEKRKMNSFKDLIIKSNTKLSIPKYRANKTKEYPQKSPKKNPHRDVLFKSNVLANLQKNRGYHLIHPQSIGKYGSTLISKYPRISVWIWSRTLHRSNGNGWLDVTPFISDLNSSVSSNGGNFSLKIAPITCEQSSSGGFRLKKEEIRFYMKDGVQEYLSQSNLFTEDDIESQDSTRVSYEGIVPVRISSHKYKKRNKFFFQQVIQPNDMVFIKFDTLEMESDERVTNSVQFEPISSGTLSNKVYDMIGLVDSSGLDMQNNSDQIFASINITGRDLIKPLIEDGTYYFPFEYANSGYKDLYFGTGQITKLSPPLFRTIKEIIESFIKDLSRIRIVEDGSLSHGTGVGTGIWKIINLIVDKAALSRTVVDSSLSIAQGSLLSTFKKICQEPFVEFYTDTYHDQFFLTVRVPPFTKKHLTQLLNGQFQDENGGTHHLEQPFIILNEGNIISESLEFNDENVHTWFSLTPKEVVGGLTRDMWMASFPPKVFPELVDIYGSKPLQIEHSYLAYNQDLGEEETVISSNIYQQSLEDLKFLIETHVHLPFTRQGRIVIVGDRRIKRGEYIFYQPTNELFYIDAVSHSFSTSSTVQNTTTIQVSRGMVVDYIRGKGQFSYFNIVDLTKDPIYKEVDDIKLEVKTRQVEKIRLIEEREIREQRIDVGTLKTKFSTKSGVDLKDINWRLLAYLDQLPSFWKSKVYITSGREGKHTTNSRHYTGDAIDLRLPERDKWPPKDTHNDALFRYIQSDPSRDVYGIQRLLHPNHGTGPHIHLQVNESYRNQYMSKEERKRNYGRPDEKDGSSFSIDIMKGEYQKYTGGNIKVPKSLITEKEEKYFETETYTEKVVKGKVKILDIEKTLETIKINKDVLSFFIERRQFTD